MRGGLDARDGRERVALGGPERQAPVAVDDVVGVELVRDGRLGPGVEAGAEHGDDGHEREPDHQRGGGRRGAARVADGVGAGELAGDAAGAARRPADDAGERLHEARGEQRDAGEQPEHAAAEQQRDAAPLTPPANMPAAIAASEASDDAEPGLGRVRGEPRRRQRRALADRRDRRHAGRPARRQDAGEQRDRRCRASSETMIVRVAMTVAAFGRSTPSALNRATMPLAMPMPERRARSAEASRPITRPSSRTERMTCLREAPSVRSVANSRVRWATVIDSVLKITNAPTSSAMPPKPSRTQPDHRHARR